MKTNFDLAWMGVVQRMLLVGLVVALAGCGKQGGPPPKMAFPVKLTPAIKMDAPVLITAFGNTEDRLSVDIVPQVSGLLMKTYIEDGAVVANGQPLFLIDPRDYAARVQQAEAAVAADQANLDLARLTFQRNQPLLAKKLISTEDFDTLKTKVDAAAAALKADEAQLAQARLNLERCTITAPLAGVCSKRFVDEGNLVAAGQSRLTNIRSYDPLDIQFSVSEEYLPLLRHVMATDPIKLEIIPRGATNRFYGTLTFLDNAVDSTTGTILLRGQVPNSDMKLWAHQFIDVHIVAGTIPDAVMVPEGVVQFGKQGPYLFVVTPDSKADLRLVKMGVRVGDLVQIESGVKAGESVVVLGQLMLFPGAPVMDVAKVPQGGGAAGGAKNVVGK